MPKQVKLKSGEVVTTYTSTEMRSMLSATIKREGEKLRTDIRAAQIKHQNNLHEPTVCV